MKSPKLSKSFKNNRLSQVAEVFLHLHQQHRTTWTQVLRHSCVKGGVAQSISCSTIKKNSQKLRMLSQSLSDCQSLTLNVMIRVSQFVRNSQQLCHYVTKSLNRSQRLRLRLRRFICLCLLVFLINCQKSHMCLRQ